jgi:hypothetical protein
MDLLIHLVIWILQGLFGESEPPARVGPRGGKDSGKRNDLNDYEDGAQRDFGVEEDFRGMDETQKPRTLQDLLEESRRKQAQVDQAAYAQDGSYFRDLQPVPYYEPTTSVSSRTTTKPAPKQKPKPKAKPPEPLTTPVADETIGLPVAQDHATELPPILKDMRASDPKVRRKAAEQALIAMMVMGPARCNASGQRRL